MDNTTVMTAAATNKGIEACRLLSEVDVLETAKPIIPLNWYSFFEELSDKLLPPMQLEFNIEIQGDRELIFQANGAVVVRS